MKQMFSILLVLMVAGCANTYQQRAATTGAVLGGTAGGVVGAQNDQVVEGVVVGAVLGGLAGAIIAQDRDDRVYVSDKHYHRNQCGRGNTFFGRAHNSPYLDEKIALMRKGIHYCPYNPAAHNDLGVALMLWGDLPGARQHFAQALRLDPDYRPARFNLNRLANYRSPRYRHEMRERRHEMRERRHERREMYEERREQRRDMREYRRDRMHDRDSRIDDARERQRQSQLQQQRRIEQQRLAAQRKAQQARALRAQQRRTHLARQQELAEHSATRRPPVNASERAVQQRAEKNRQKMYERFAQQKAEEDRKAKVRKEIAARKAKARREAAARKAKVRRDAAARKARVKAQKKAEREAAEERPGSAPETESPSQRQQRSG